MAEEKAMSLEEFELQRPGVLIGRAQQWLLGLAARTPKMYRAHDSQTPQAARTQIHNVWRGASGSVRHAVRDQKRGKMRTIIVDNDLWVVWYPEENNGT